MKDFFISYSYADIEWAQRIDTWLRDAGYTTFVDFRDIALGQNIGLETLRALQEAKHVIALLSPDYLNVLYTAVEWEAALFQDPTGAQRKLIPVRVRACDPPGMLAAIVYIDLTKVDEDEATRRQRLLRGIKQALATAQPTPVGVAPQPRPITVRGGGVGDQAAEVDELGFAPYVQAVATFLTDKRTKPPLTLSIEGEWGSGKSSFMRQLAKSIAEKQQESVAVWFDAWRHNREEELWAAFALSFIQQLSEHHWGPRRSWLRFQLGWRRRQAWWSILWPTLWLLLVALLVLVALWLFAQRLPSWLRWLTPGLWSVLAGLGGGLTLLYKGLKEIGAGQLEAALRRYMRDPKYEEHLTLLHRFHQDFKDVVDLYAGNKTVYIFVDDLDRCDAGTSASLMQAINLMIADNPKLIFVLGMDREKVAAGYAVKHEKILPLLHAAATAWPQQPDARFTALAALDYGFNFMEKFIQLPFRIPRPRIADLRKLIDNNDNGRPREQGPAGQQPIKSTAPSIKAETPSQPEPSPEPEPRVAIREVDSDDIIAIAMMVMPVLNHNPRRLKQFVNLFRLQVCIADAAQALTHHAQGGLSLAQIGKFVAIMLKWPRLLSELKEVPTLLQDLAKIAYGTAEQASAPSPPRALYWSKDEALLELLRAGCFDEEKQLRPDLQPYELELADLRPLLDVASLTYSPSEGSLP